MRLIKISKPSKHRDPKKLPVPTKGQLLQVQKQKQVGTSLISPEAKENVREKHNDHIKFSFTYFDRDTQLFNCSGTNFDWFVCLVDHLKEVSKLTKKEFLFDKKYFNHYEPHQHAWDKVKHSYPMPPQYFEQIKDECWQFRLASSNGRVHGFVIGNVFYVVWLDPHHNFYPSDRHGGEKLFKPLILPFDKLQYEHKELQEEYERLKADHETLQELAEAVEQENKDLKKAQAN
ncbi:TPA: hypothetical protein QC445_003127 [Bacillus cereus]|uniref:cell division protein ZapB n=1 Tax=Bacillus cereus group TaxID=86661 RepID=UPI001F567DE8|nr:MULTISPECIES: cell division protein ZapB [Bacillus cereus group]MEB4819062.1 cell division protein ZapB [Bacillus thuringiensis]UNP78283.1 cell division protein ZapB [Bacillus nitratireducens]HDR8486316.1 hypothetical protein [Bacillus cereus]